MIIVQIVHVRKKWSSSWRGFKRFQICAMQTKQYELCICLSHMFLSLCDVCLSYYRCNVNVQLWLCLICLSYGENKEKIQKQAICRKFWDVKSSEESSFSLLLYALMREKRENPGQTKLPRLGSINVPIYMFNISVRKVTVKCRRFIAYKIIPFVQLIMCTVATFTGFV